MAETFLLKTHPLDFAEQEVFLMFAMTISDGKLVKSSLPDPVVTPERSVLIQVAAAAVNRADLMQCDGNYPSPQGWPEWPGLEVSGVVLASPEKSRFHAGDRVCALLGGGGYASMAAVPEEMVLPVPENVSMEEAAGIPEVFATAWLNLMLEAKMQKGDTVLVQAGASGLGLAAIQLAKIHGCRVLTTVGSESKAEFVKKLGADIAVNRRTTDLGAVLDENPPDIVLDCVGGGAMGDLFCRMAPWGRWIQLAALAGSRTEIPLDVVFRKRLRLIGSTLRSRTEEMKGQILADLERNLWPLFSSGKLRSIIWQKLPMNQANEAHGILRRNENIGKVILSCTEDF